MLRVIWDELVRRGASPHELERLSGITRPQNDDFLSAVCDRDAHLLFEAGIALTGEQTLGLSVGRAIGPGSFHLLGLLAMASASLSQTIENAVRVQPHRGMRLPSLEELPDGRIRFGMPAHDKLPTPGARLEAEMTAVLLHDLVLHFIDRNVASPTVEFPFREPADLSPYRRAFASGVRFDGSGTYIYFPKAALLRRRSGADSALTEQLVKLAQEQYGGIEALTEDWAARVRRALRVHRAPRLVEASKVAAQLGVSARGLSRRLSREGTSLSSLIDAELFDRAQTLLREPDATTEHVASALGYAELSSFFRAFRRWSGGLTPRGYHSTSS